MAVTQALIPGPSPRRRREIRCADADGGPYPRPFSGPPSPPFLQRRKGAICFPLPLGEGSRVRAGEKGDSKHKWVVTHLCKPRYERELDAALREFLGRLRARPALHLRTGPDSGRGARL